MKNLGSKTIETNRLILKVGTINEQKYLWGLIMKPEINKYYLTIPKRYKDKLSDWSIQEKYYLKEMKHSLDFNVYKWSIFLKDGGNCIGKCDCHEAKDENEEITNPNIRGVGWIIDSKYQGNGYGTEAAEAMIKYMFEEVEIDSIITSAAIKNISSWKIMEKLGFKRNNKIKLVQYTFQDNLTENYEYILTKEMYFKKNVEK